MPVLLRMQGLWSVAAPQARRLLRLLLLWHRAMPTGTRAHGLLLSRALERVSTVAAFGATQGVLTVVAGLGRPSCVHEAHPSPAVHSWGGDIIRFKNSSCVMRGNSSRCAARKCRKPPHNPASPIMKNRCCARVSATLSRFGFAAAQAAAPWVRSSHPSTIQTMLSSLPWKVWTVPIRAFVHSCNMYFGGKVTAPADIRCAQFSGLESRPINSSLIRLNGEMM